jgi:N-acetylneuraminic acid mutarotase
MICGTAVFQDKIWILGGGTYGTACTPERKYYNDVWCSEDGMSWHCCCECAPWEPRSYHNVAVFDNKLWVLGGCYPKGDKRPQNYNDVWFSEDGSVWQELPGTPWEPRHAASVLVHDGALWVISGNNMESDVWKMS